MVFIPSVFDCLHEDNKWHVKQCYLAEILKKKEFREQCKNYEKINHSLVMKEIIERVSFEIPEPEGYFPWFLVKKLVSGTLKARIYSLDLSNAQIDQFLNKLRRPIETKETWDNLNADRATQEIENIAEVLTDFEKIEHFAKDDIFQIEEHLERIHLADEDMDFPALDEQEALIAMSDDWWTTLETNFREATSVRCPNVMGTPKRKAPRGDSPPDTPSKASRKNLEHSYVGPDSNIGEPRDDDPLAAPLDPSFPDYTEQSGIGATDITDPPVVPPEGEQPPPAPPGPAAAADQSAPATAASADDVPLPETSGGPVPAQEPSADVPGDVPADVPEDVPEDVPDDVPVPRRRPRPRPRAIIISDATMQKRIRKIDICTISIGEGRADPKKLKNLAAVLLNQPATSWEINGTKSSIADKNFPPMPKIQNDEQGFDESFYGEAENMRSARERNFPAAEDTGPPPGVDISAPNDVQPEPMEVEEPSDAPIPRNETIPEPAPPVFTSHVVPESPSSTSSREWIPVPERSSTTLRSSEKTVDSDSIPSNQNLLQSEFTKEKFVTILNLIFENMIESGACIDERPGVAFNVVMNPEICPEEVYILALNYSMELMRERRLTMKQAKPYDPVILIPSKSWPEPDEPIQI